MSLAGKDSVNEESVAEEFSRGYKNLSLKGDSMTEHHVKVLIIDEDTGFLEEAATELSDHFTVYTSATGGNGLKVFAQLRPQVVIVDAGISDIPFASLLDDLKGLDGAVLRIATSHDYNAIEKVVQAIETAHIHKYFRKPVNYFDLIEIINARTVRYQVGRGILQGVDISPAYEKLHTIVDKAKEVEKLRQQLESQMTKVRDVEAESFNKVKDVLGEVDAFRKKIADREAVISSLQAKSLELEELKKRDIDRVERERAALRQELKGVQEEYEKLVREKADIELALKELEIATTSEKAATLSVSEELKKTDRQKKDGKDSFLAVDDEPEITDTFRQMMRKQFNVYTADNGRNALRVLEENPDIGFVITDQRMPEMTGLEFAAEVKKTHPELPIYMLSGFADLQMAIDAMNKGLIVKYFEKPVVDWDAIEAEIHRAVETYDQALTQKEIITEKKLFIVDQIRELTAQSKTLGYNNAKLGEELSHLKSGNEKQRKEIEKMRAENAELRVSVSRERKAMIEEMARERRTLEEELARKKDEAERAVEVQKERNKAELQKVQEAFEKEKQRAAQEIERLKSELEEKRKARLAEIEQERKRAEAELEEFRRQQAKEKAAIEKSLEEEKQRADREIRRLKAEFEEDRKAKLAEIEAGRKRVEEELARKKDEAERIVEVQKERHKAELQKLQDAFEQEKQHTAQEIRRLKAEFEEDRKAKLAEIEAGRKRVEEELARKKDEAERIVEAQKERNKAELQKLQDAFEQEKQHTAREMERFKATLEEDRKAKLAQIEIDRKRVEQELAAIRARMTEEKEKLEKSVEEQREKAEAEIRRFRESAAMEQKKLTEELEVKLAAMKKAAEAEVQELRVLATRELDQYKAEAKKKERELNEALVQARRMARETEDQLRLTEGRIKTLESDIEKNLKEKDLVLEELASVRSDFDVAIQSREALVAEVAELRNRLK